MIARMIVFCFLTTSMMSWAAGQPPKIASKKESSLMHRINPVNWKMPELKAPEMKLPSFTTTTKKPKVVRRKSPGFWQRLSQSSKQTWNKTIKFLNPFDGPKKPKKPGFFEELFTVKPEPRPVETVGDFLRQPHPY